MINLFENYDDKTRELHDSLKLAGYNHFTIVMNDDGFYLMKSHHRINILRRIKYMKMTSPLSSMTLSRLISGKLKVTAQWPKLSIWVS